MIPFPPNGPPRDPAAGPAARPIAVVDLDGVVADVRHRLHHLHGGRKNWDAFFAGIPADPVLPEGRAVVDRLAVEHELVYLTGRPERTRADSEAWLRHHQLPRGSLIMRRDGDRRPARLVKAGHVRTLGRDRRVAVVVDDDAAVCAALERDGWPVLRADWMPAEAALQRAQEQDGRT